MSDIQFNELKEMAGEDNLDFLQIFKDFTTFEKFKHFISSLKLGVNIAFFMGQGEVRKAVIGMENRPATPQELERMKQIVEEAMKSGALGISTGLIYTPGVFTPKDELIELCKVVAQYDGYYVTHMRSESDYVIDAVKEAIDIGRQSGSRVWISHHKIAGKSNWGKSRQIRSFQN